ncbi:hypothetical protein AALP_AA7G181200 [Arabis alpina]|uniref:beta-glucosidase n=1 Tax=Arabis alpina TaxID=50452 RepID=A0A087GIV0_ARAAL|nr:hypothetical protein AALP_AA7G181200 [Arabis alpina]
MDRVLSLITIFLVLVFSSKCSHGYSRIDFPKDFTFGSAISAYQWEGAANEDGRKPSIWDTYVHSRNQDNGDIACDGYHKYKEDVQLMVKTGLDALRFSISWSRLIPNGRGPINPKGLQFYKNFINELVTNGIEPHVTLFHYDLPQSLEDEYGGWISRRIIKDFTAYADVCFREFGNHVKFWNTINEANVFTIGGYNDGTQPPGRCSKNCSSGNSSTEPYLVGHHLLLAHASASRLYTKKYKETQGDFYIGWMLEPLIFGDYPDSMKRTIGTRLPIFTEEESELVKGSADFLGIIYYFAATVTKSKPSHSGYSDFNTDSGLANYSSLEYDVLPWAMEGVLEYIKQSYGNPPVYILENGKSMKRGLKSELKDTPRIEFLDAYIGAVLRAIRNGSDTRGYFVWSFMDLYELLVGYEASFGLYYVNFSDPHLKRSSKLSAQWYSALLKGNDTTTFFGSQGITQLQSNLSSSYSSL